MTKKKPIKTAPAKKSSKQKLNIRERRFIKFLMAGDSATEAMRKAGYAENTAGSKQSEKLAKVGSTIQDLCDKMGLTDEKLVGTLQSGLNADKVISANVVAPSGEGMADAHGMTKDFIEVPDWTNRLKAVDLGLKLKNKYPAEKKEHDITLHDAEVFEMPALSPPEEVTGD